MKTRKDIRNRSFHYSLQLRIYTIDHHSLQLNIQWIIKIRCSLDNLRVCKYFILSSVFSVFSVFLPFVFFIVARRHSWVIVPVVPLLITFVFIRSACLSACLPAYLPDCLSVCLLVFFIITTLLIRHRPALLIIFAFMGLFGLSVLPC